VAITQDHPLVISLTSKRDGGDATQRHAAAAAAAAAAAHAADVNDGAMANEINSKGSVREEGGVDDVRVAVGAADAHVGTRGSEGDAVDDGPCVFATGCGGGVFKRQSFEGFGEGAVGLKHFVEVHLGLWVNDV